MRPISRDEFSLVVKEALAKRVGQLCSRPDCEASTSGPHSDSRRYINLGVACHITAAAQGGPRYDESLKPEERSSIDNAIWLCQTCAKLIDSDQTKYTVAMLTGWKVAAEAKAMRAFSGKLNSDYFPQPASAKHTPIPRIAGLTYDEARERLIHAGWQPRVNHFAHASNFDMQVGNGLHFWEKGYHEIISASGTGLGLCTFGFHDVYGNQLVVVSAGEVIEEYNATAHIWCWYFTKDENDA